MSKLKSRQIRRVKAYSVAKSYAWPQTVAAARRFQRGIFAPKPVACQVCQDTGRIDDFDYGEMNRRFLTWKDCPECTAPTKPVQISGEWCETHWRENCQACEGFALTPAGLLAAMQFKIEAEPAMTW